MVFIPAEKLLIISFVKMYKVGSWFSVSIAELINTHPCSRKSITAFLKTMEVNGFIEIKKRYGGTSSNRYRITSKAANYIQSDDVLGQVLRHQKDGLKRIINERYIPINEASIVESISNLNRFFLLILMLHSNSLGSVNNLSFKELAEIMGGTKDQVKSQIICLKKAGLIRNHASGISHKDIFGKEKGILLLDVKHPFISGFYYNISKLILDVSQIHDLEYLGFPQSFSLIMRMPSIHLKQKYNDYIDMNLIYEVMTKKDIRLHEQIQYLIYDVASKLLRSPSKLSSQQVEELILNKLSPNSEVLTQKAHLELAKLIRRWVFRQARIYEALLLFIYGENVSYEKVLILPSRFIEGRISSFEILFENVKTSLINKCNDDIYKVNADFTIIDKHGQLTTLDFSLLFTRIKQISHDLK